MRQPWSALYFLSGTSPEGAQVRWVVKCPRAPDGESHLPGRDGRSLAARNRAEFSSLGMIQDHFARQDDRSLAAIKVITYLPTVEGFVMRHFEGEPLFDRCLQLLHHAIIDCCTREIVGWELSLRCRAVEAIAVIERAVREQAIAPGTLTLGTDNGSAFTARATRLVINRLGVAHRRGGYRDPESQAFIESWFRYLKERCVWRNEFETIEQAREVIAAYIDQPHSRLNYRTPHEVRSTWDDAQGALQTTAA